MFRVCVSPRAREVVSVGGGLGQLADSAALRLLARCSSSKREKLRGTRSRLVERFVGA